MKKSDTPSKSCDKVIRGGNLSVIPKPHIRRYPRYGNPKQSDGKRTVLVHIYSWIGLDPDAEHYYLDIQEEGNPIWDWIEKSWRFAWDDRCHSISYNESFPDLMYAVYFARHFVKENFNNRTHSIRLRYEGNTIELTVDGFITTKSVIKGSLP